MSEIGFSVTKTPSVQIREKCPLNDGIPQFSYMISIFIRNYHQNQALSQNQFWETVLQNNFGNVNAVRLVLISPIMWGQTVSTSYKNNSFNSNKAAVGKIRFGGNNLEKAIFSGKRALLSSKRALFSSKRALFLSKAAHFLPRGHFFNTNGTGQWYFPYEIDLHWVYY